MKVKNNNNIFQKPEVSKARVRTKQKANIIKNSLDLNEKIKNIGNDKSYYIRTYGCQMNENDSEKISAILEELNYTKAYDYENADVILLNTCAIREGAENKVFGFIGELKRLKTTNPDLIIGICGCMPQEEETINQIYQKYPQIDLMFGTHNFHRLPSLLQEAYYSKEQIVEVWSEEGNVYEDIPVKRDSKYKAWVTIMYGCDRFCTYCIVPYTRGSERSRLKSDIIEEVNQLIKEGYKEITLLGQNVNSYGIDFEEKYDICNLVTDIAKLNIPRIRIMTSNPWNFSDELIEVFKRHENVLPYVHLPLQSGNSEILKLMGRRHTKEEYIELFDKIKSSIPNVSITTDIIVGFPNETEEQFADTIDVVNHCKFDAAFTFIYSKRSGTPAAKMEDNVSIVTKKQRLQELNKFINKYAEISNQAFIGKTVKVLVDGPSKKNPDVLSGYCEQNKIVLFEGNIKDIGEIVDVKIDTINTWSMYGTRIK
ncbi:MAG: tRNA (N6-isopentenyl adenosine(37)-C2)-methylthiotransferase MiaB [Bacilli bacterium]